MSTLIVGRFQQLSSADSAVRDLGRVGFRKPEMCLVYVNPHGQHAIHPVGGDLDESPGTHEAGSGAMTGAAGGLGAGTLVGVATLPALGPVGPLLGAAVGAYAGALVGALKNMDENVAQEPDSPPPREPGMLLAVAADAPARRDSAIEILSEYADEVEEIEGTLRDGDWVDFDPLQPGKTIG